MIGRLVICVQKDLIAKKFRFTRDGFCEGYGWERVTLACLPTWIFSGNVLLSHSIRRKGSTAEIIVGICSDALVMSFDSNQCADCNVRRFATPAEAILET